MFFLNLSRNKACLRPSMRVNRARRVLLATVRKAM
jgi:hypothetical protein